MTSLSGHIVMYTGIFWGLVETAYMFIFRKKGDESRDKVSFRLIYAVTWISFGLGIYIGVYSQVKHLSFLYSPSIAFNYAGVSLIIAGMAISFGNWLGFIIIFFPYFCVILKRMDAEEKVLLSHFGEKYREYMGRRKRIIPFLY